VNTVSLLFKVVVDGNVMRRNVIARLFVFMFAALGYCRVILLALLYLFVIDQICDCFIARCSAKLKEHHLSQFCGRREASERGVLRTCLV
jgi:hypothetical protein